MRNFDSTHLNELTLKLSSTFNIISTFYFRSLLFASHIYLIFGSHMRFNIMFDDIEPHICLIQNHFHHREGEGGGGG